MPSSFKMSNPFKMLSPFKMLGPSRLSFGKQMTPAPQFFRYILLLISVISIFHFYTQLHVNDQYLDTTTSTKTLRNTTVVHPPVVHTPVVTNLHSAWRDPANTCSNWISTQRATGGYIDAYIVGSQKGGTSVLSKRLFSLGVKHKELRKEWHVFSAMSYENYTEADQTPLNTDQLSELRLRHYHTGFFEPPTNDTIPVVSNAQREVRKVVIDGTVEYMHNSAAAYLASLATPHARIVMTFRDPIDRALSQYNMIVRNGNIAAAQKGQPTKKASPHEFHERVTAEMSALQACGYNVETASFKGSTFKLMGCVHARTRLPFYVLRGLYPLHIRTWREYFPDRHIMYVSFREMAQGLAHVFNDLCDFLCIRAFDKETLEGFRNEGGHMSYGQRSIKEVVTEGFDSYEGDNKYLGSVLPETRQVLEKFFAPAMKKTTDMLGKDPF